MENKNVLILVFLGTLFGLIVGTFVGIAYFKTTPATKDEMTMDHSSHESLQDKYGDEFDKLFVDQMIVHHQGAIDMAKLAESRAVHQEIKDMSHDIISTQSKEIEQMNYWKAEWFK